LFSFQIVFERSSQTEGETKSKVITRNLYHRLNPLPQKKVMTFNRKPNDFHFNSSYGDLTFLSDGLKRLFFVIKFLIPIFKKEGHFIRVILNRLLYMPFLSFPLSRFVL